MLVCPGTRVLFAAEEDFGIALVEAQSYGLPIIAYGQGGALETVIDAAFTLTRRPLACCMETKRLNAYARRSISSSAWRTNLIVWPFSTTREDSTPVSFQEDAGPQSPMSMQHNSPSLLPREEDEQLLRPFSLSDAERNARAPLYPTSSVR